MATKVHEDIRMGDIAQLAIGVTNGDVDHRNDKSIYKFKFVDDPLADSQDIESLARDVVPGISQDEWNKVLGDDMNHLMTGGGIYLDEKVQPREPIKDSTGLPVTLWSVDDQLACLIAANELLLAASIAVCPDVDEIYIKKDGTCYIQRTKDLSTKIKVVVVDDTEIRLACLMPAGEGCSFTEHLKPRISLESDGTIHSLEARRNGLSLQLVSSLSTVD